MGECGCDEVGLCNYHQQEEDEARREPCAICGARSDELDGEGTCPRCQEDEEGEE